jgi:hypothetical protein
MTLFAVQDVGIFILPRDFAVVMMHQFAVYTVAVCKQIFAVIDVQIAVVGNS